MSSSKECDRYIIDTCKLMDSGQFLPGAITFKGRKKIEAIQWKGEERDSQEEADAFVRAHFSALGIVEVNNEGELRNP